jgi:hypothetical protein
MPLVDVCTVNRYFPYPPESSTPMIGDLASHTEQLRHRYEALRTRELPALTEVD